MMSDLRIPETSAIAGVHLDRGNHASARHRAEYRDLQFD